VALSPLASRSQLELRHGPTSASSDLERGAARRASQEAFMSTPHTILVPTDFTEPSDLALDYAEDLAAKLDATIVLLHVSEVPSIGIVDPPGMVTRDLINSMEEVSVRGLERVIEKHQRPGVTIRPMVKVGDTLQQIEEAAAEVGADLICMGTHRRSGLRRALLGSTAELLVRKSDVPVLTVKETRHEN
jgi:nucleotide-binding universal stress UspA family protein